MTRGDVSLGELLLLSVAVGWLEGGISSMGGRSIPDEEDLVVAMLEAGLSPHVCRVSGAAAASSSQQPLSSY